MLRIFSPRVNPCSASLLPSSMLLMITPLAHGRGLMARMANIIAKMSIQTRRVKNFFISFSCAHTIGVCWSLSSTCRMHLQGVL